MTGSLHAQVARDLIDAIGAGRYPVGSHLPTELELSAQYDASRNTIRAALQELQDLGLISRKRRAGTRVEAAAPAVGYRHSIASVETLMQFGAAHSRIVLGVEPITTGRALARRLGCAVGTPWLLFTSLRHAAEADAPIALTESYLDPRYADLRAEIEASPTVLMSTLVERHHGRRIAEIDQEIGATIITPAVAEQLRCEAGSAGLAVTRRYIDPAGVAFLITVSTHPSDRFTVSLRLRREAER